jgi:RNA polymerase primary sigma factor
VSTSSGVGWWLDQIGRVPLLTPTQELEYGRHIQLWRTHPEGPDHCPPMVQRRGLRARERFIKANLRLVINVAKRFRRMVHSESFGDLVQAGNIGLVEAVERFDPSRGYRFSTYACYWIQMRVTGHIERHERTIRMPTTITYKVSTIPKVIRRLLGELGREPTRADLAEALQMSEEEIDRVFVVGRPCASLDATISHEDGNSTLGDLVAATYTPDEPDEQQEELRRQLLQLPDKVREIVQAVYGIDCGQQSIAQVALRYGMQRVAVVRVLRQVEHDLAMVLNPEARQLKMVDGVTAVSEPAWLQLITDQLGPPVTPCRRRRERPNQLELNLPKRVLRGRKKRRRSRRVA